MAILRRVIKNFYGAPRAFMAMYGANVAGFFWNAGTLMQFIFGMITASPLEITSSAFNIASPCSFLFFGHRNWGVVFGCMLGAIGTFLAVYPQILAGENASIFGFIAFCALIQLSIFSRSLTRRFAGSRNAFLRRTLGHPRRTNGIATFFCVRMPIIFESLTHDRWQLAAVFALWAVGDVAYSFSRADVQSKNRK